MGLKGNFTEVGVVRPTLVNRGEIEALGERVSHVARAAENLG
jgi:hypothetical protein